MAGPSEKEQIDLMRQRINSLESQVNDLERELNAFLQSAPMRLATRCYRLGLKVFEVLSFKKIRLKASHIIRQKRFKSVHKQCHEGVVDRVDIVVPVYRDLEGTQRCLKSVLAAQVKTPFELTVINDASPDPVLTQWLKDFCNSHSISLIHHPQNLGFVQSANEGFECHQNRDVVLLNSDTEVFDGWLDGIRATALSDSSIGTVTPFSNNATICSYPVFCGESDPDPNTRRELAQRFGQIDSVPVDLPTGVGFCFYVRRGLLRDVGSFDVDHFGRGYGEENDFCLRAAARGWRNVLCPQVYVYHQGSSSFGSERHKRVQNALKVLHRIHPHYGRLVADFIEEDPIREIRQTVSLARFRDLEQPVILLVSHECEGGVPRHMDELRAMAKSNKVTTLSLFSGKQKIRCVWDSEQAELATWPKNDFPKSFFKDLNVSRIHLHHTLNLPKSWLEGLFDCGPVYYTLHDYYPLFGEPKLTGLDHRYVQDPTKRSHECAVKSGIKDISAFQRSHRQWLCRSEKVIAPTSWVAKEYHTVFPEVNIEIAPHLDNRKYPNPISIEWENESIRVLVLGALGPEKGADILEATARECENEKISFSLLGFAYRKLDPCVQVYGKYEEEHLVSRIGELKPHLIWFPCQWPETYSYTLSAALELGLPIAAPNLGAFSDRLQGRPNTWLLDWPCSVSNWSQFFRCLSIEFPLSSKLWDQRESKPFYEEYFLNLLAERI